MRTRIASSLLILCAAAVPHARAQTAVDTANPTPTPTPAATVAVEQPKSSVTKAKDTLSVDFPDEEIRTVLRNVADLFELNLVIPDTLQGKTSVKLRDVTWRQIYKVVLEPVNYTFVEDGNIIKVVTVESLNLEPLSTEVFVLNYARAADIKPSLDALVDTKLGGKIVVDTRSNALVVTERPSAIQRVRPIIANLDHATEQVMVETKFIEVTDRDVKNIGVNWSSLNNYSVGIAKIERSYKDTQNRTDGYSRSEANTDVPFMQQGYEKADTLASRNVFGPNTDPAHGIGPKYTVDDDTGVTFSDIGPSSLLSKAFSGGLDKVTSAVFSADDFSLIVSALKTLNDTKLVSNPTVVTLNNNEATINIGEEYPVPNYTYNQERGSFEVSGFAYKSIGVNLKVTPQVNSAGFIKLTVEPEVSSRNGTVNFGGAGGAEIPIIGVRKTKTQVTLKDGYTLGLGGLVENTTIKDQTKVPLLGDIPGLGRLFRSDGNDKTTRNLIVFITARTLKPDGASVGEVFDPRMIREMKISKDELPGYRDGSDPFYKAPATAEKK
ncbi:MAG TPA: secretin N-terminal domain-containing protein [Opitutaceae bacterium]|nr:secretin N-terminal domain-containing protein [Opitutaceae bacterium]